MKTINTATAESILDFSGGEKSLKALGNLQLEGAVALHNMLADPSIGMGYLADEVGMGKTYIALGVVALMRYFNPTLRVLYICPSRNVQDKWRREYLSFIKNNVKVSGFRIRTANGKPAAPFISCRNVPEMIRTAAIGYYSDFFVGKDSFSISLDDHQETWEKKCRSIQDLLPAHEWDGIVQSKQDVKDRYAAALNYILPTFDLVIIDEAHNFKHSINSSDRNKVLSKVLGFRESFQPRIKRALLLSATPYDRNLNQLRNQLTLINKSSLLPENPGDKEALTSLISKFMVRRLNSIKINGSQHTRNMYRQEHRTGGEAEVELQSDEQKLVTALVQKKVGEMMNRSGSNPAFQIGMMASFESYAQTAKTEPVQFDGDDADKEHKDPQDRHVVTHIVDSFKAANLGKTLPHPKMDTVSLKLAEKLFMQSKKQIVFVRRVKSVKELKEKLDVHYNDWIESYIGKQLKGNNKLKSLFNKLFEQYKQDSLYKEIDISDGNFIPGKEGDTEDSQPPKQDTFFSWYFRGGVSSNAQSILNKGSRNVTTPDALRKGLTSKNQTISLILELNWARYISTKENIELSSVIDINFDEILQNARKYTVSQLQDDKLDLYRACQLGFIEWYSEQTGKQYLATLFRAIKSQQITTSEVVEKEISLADLKDNLCIDTLYTGLEENGLLSVILPLQEVVYTKLKENNWDIELFDKLDTNCHLISLCIRTGHGVIDLYLSRLKQGVANLTIATRKSWIQDFIICLKEQQGKTEFSTFNELHSLSDQLDLIIKVNIPEVYDVPVASRRTYISHRLNPVSPFIGATGETSASRSAQARKFRMPGYPLGLVSTNVFQEGEDLHTFCDSVVHYGLSGSPVSIEQKTGRVDRVNSISQRRFTLHEKNAEKTKEEDLIQVTFPYIKESIELLQVRQLCHNINGFIESLHELESPKMVKQDIVNTNKALQDKSSIPEQISCFLKSPYVPNKNNNDVESLVPFVDAQTKSTQDIIRSVKSIVKELYGVNVFKDGFNVSNSQSRNIQVRLDSARSSGELLLIAELNDGEYRLSQSNLFKVMQEKSWGTYHRTLATEVASGVYQLIINTEMLVSDEKITQREDIEHFFGRINQNFESNTYNKPTDSTIIGFCKKISSGKLSLYGKRLNVEVELKDSESCLELKFIFDDLDLPRTHVIQLYQADDLCVFISKAITKLSLEKFQGNRDKKIIEYTWIRNKFTDVVEFLLDPNGGISGRIIHPINSINWEEFVFCAYLLAAEADRLEYVVEQEDIL